MDLFNVILSIIMIILGIMLLTVDIKNKIFNIFIIFIFVILIILHVNNVIYILNSMQNGEKLSTDIGVLLILIGILLIIVNIYQNKNKKVV
jgi:hypothetical protein